uniref:NAD(P)-dependent oxidoreductase n=1 Tax=Chryseobacterium endophyticum TaxID=1854762 RepID=A0AAU6WVE6_9FLAO
MQLPALISLSKKKGFGIYFGKGENIWSNVHIEDLADLYILALEKSKAGSLYYAENGASTIKNLAEKISDRYSLQPARSVTVQEAVDTFGPAGGYFGFASNSLCSSDKARTELQWKPQHQSIEYYI